MERNEIEAYFDRLLDEVDSYYADIKRFNDRDLVANFRNLAAFSARASEMRSQLHRLVQPKAVQIRTKHIDPFLEEIDRQFKTWSRIQSVKELEMKLDGKL